MQITIMLREVSVMLIVDLSLASVVQHSPFQFHAFASGTDHIQIVYTCMRLTTITYS
jgi:hypothetical protein